MGTEAGGARADGLRLKLARWLGEGVSPLPLIVFRVGFGLLMFGSALRFVLKGWVEMQYLEPAFHFRYFLFDWVRPLSGDWLYAVFALQMACGLLLAAGRLYRWAAIGFFLSFTYVELLEKAAYLNHYYFVSLVSFLLIFLPLDRWGQLGGVNALGGTRPRGGATSVAPEPVHSLAPRWIALALRLQLGIVYVFAGLAKLNEDWLFSALPIRIWLSSRTGLPILGPLFDAPWVAFAMSWGGAAFDLSIPFLLAARRTRPWAYLAVVGFHAATAVLFPIGMFPWIMIVATLVFFDGADLKWLTRRVAAVRGAVPGAMPAAVPRAVERALPPSPLSRGLRPVLVGFFALQLLLPLRHLAYPGSVLWTEEGYRFSWRVMLMEKAGAVVFRVTDPPSGRSWEVYPRDILTAQQEKQMSFQPDMILEVAHHLADVREAAGHARPEVRADAFVSLNGRPNERLIDPNVDLARVEKGLGPKSWVRSGGGPL